MCAEPLLTTSDVAEYCRVTRMGVSRWIRDGKLKAYRTPGGHFRILRSDFREFLERFGLPVDATLYGDDERRRVLVLSGNQGDASFIGDALESTSGYQVTWASDAYDAGIKVATLNPDLIVMEMGMTGLDTFALSSRIGRDPLSAHIKILGLVESTSPDVEAHLRSCGVTALLVRPLIGQDIARVVGSLLEG